MIRALITVVTVFAWTACSAGAEPPKKCHLSVLYVGNSSTPRGKAFRSGFKNPPEAATLEPDPSVSLDGAAAYLKQQVARIHNDEQMTRECSVEGPYAHKQWVYIHLRHAELHLSFLSLVD
jgi:hypothetical protein